MRDTIDNPAPAASSRRRFLLAATGAAVLAPLAGCGGGGGGAGGGGGFAAAGSALGAPASQVVETTSGRFQGQASGSVVSFLGVPYARAPVGALRFRAPQPYQAGSEVVDANAFGAASIQTIPPNTSWIYPTPAVQSEDCLSLNVWTPDPGGKAPVVVFIHGGGFRSGATSMPLMNGQLLSEQGVVVVTMNYRLGALGLLSHPDFTDPANGTSANWQQQDMAAALQWVKQNIAAFGGDPANVCLMGQSGGAMSAAIFAQNPAVRSTFQKVILLSPPMVAVPSCMTLTDAASYTELIATRLGTTPLGLRNVDAKTLNSTELALNALPLPAGFSSGFAFKLAPLIDGRVCLADWTRSAWPADLPLLMTYTLNEGAFFEDLVDPATDTRLTPPLPTSIAGLTASVAPLVGGSASAAAAVINAYTQAAQLEGIAADPGSLWVEIYGDRILRNYGTRYVQRLAGTGANVRFGTYLHAVKAPGRGVPHCADLPMIFGSYGLDYYKDKVGAGAAESRLSGDLASMIVSFARDASNVQLASGFSWPRLDANLNLSALIGNGTDSGVYAGPVPKTAQMAVWDSLLGY
jgi:para-nitrobenzyl esterase